MKTPAQIRATEKYNSANYDSVLIRLPKGTKDRIRLTGETINGLVTRLVLEELERLGK